MENPQELSYTEKELLNTIGKLPDLSANELLKYTSYRRKNSIVRKLEELKRQDLLFGPVYRIDYGKLCRNPFHKFYCTLETHQDLEKLISYLQLIEPLTWIFPVLSAHKKLLHVGFLSSDDTETITLLQLLKDNDIITDYVARLSLHRRLIENPNFFGDPSPSLDNLSDLCEIPDMCSGCHDTDWNECDMNILPHLLSEHKGIKLIKILKRERKLGRNWTYDQIKYSREKMVRNNLIKKEYNIFPFLYNLCVHFILLLRPEDPAMTPQILYNFARGARVYKEYVVCEDWGLVECISHPVFLTNLMNKLDLINEIRDKELYQLRSLSPDKYRLFRPPEFKYFDSDTQRLEYPYSVYKERIREKLENE